MSTPMSGINTFEKFCAYCNEILGDNWSTVANSPNGGFRQCWDWTVANNNRKDFTWWHIFKSVQSSTGYIHWAITCIITNGTPYIENGYYKVNGGNGKFDFEWSMWAISDEAGRRYGPNGNPSTLSSSDENPTNWINTQWQLPDWARDARPIDVLVKLTDIYDIKPTQRILKVVTSQQLPAPADRNKNYMYFVYDKMLLFLYQSRYSDPFSIVEALPDVNDMVENMLYITLDGYLYTRFAKSIVRLGNVELVDGVPDPAQLAIFRKAGTTYFMNAESRYLDTQTRTLQLPFQNGNYQLSLSLARENMIDNDTIIKYNQETNQFEVMGNKFQPFKWLKDIYRYTAVTTQSISTYLEAGYNAIRSEINVVDDPNNALQVLSSGLYVNTSEFVDNDRYSALIEAFYAYKNIIDRYVNELKDAILNISVNISPEAIDQKIDDTLTDYEPTMLTMINQYNDFSNRLDVIEAQVHYQTDTRIADTKQQIISYVNTLTSSTWDTFPVDLDDPYYQYHSS